MQHVLVFLHEKSFAIMEYSRTFVADWQKSQSLQSPLGKRIEKVMGRRVTSPQL